MESGTPGVQETNTSPALGLSSRFLSQINAMGLVCYLTNSWGGRGGGVGEGWGRRGVGKKNPALLESF